MEHNLENKCFKKADEKRSALHTISLRERILRFLFGRKQQITIIVPGDSVKELAICKHWRRRNSMMGKGNGELAAELSELKHCGEVLISLSESIMALISGKDTPQPMDKPSAKEIR